MNLSTLKFLADARAIIPSEPVMALSILLKFAPTALIAVAASPALSLANQLNKLSSFVSGVSACAVTETALAIALIGSGRAFRFSDAVFNDSTSIFSVTSFNKAGKSSCPSPANAFIAFLMPPIDALT